MQISATVGSSPTAKGLAGRRDSKRYEALYASGRHQFPRNLTSIDQPPWFATLRTAGDPLPAGILSVAPFSDLTLSGPSVRKFNGDDPAANKDLLTFMGASYFQGHEPTDPLVSPLFGDLANLPPLFLTATQGEALLDDTTRLAEKAAEAGVDVTLKLVEDSVHVYTIFPFLPETQSTMAEVAEWARRCMRRNDTRPQAAE